MQVNSVSSYKLKDLHQAIDLMDRKIVHCRNWGTFESQEAREIQLRKLSSKRATLVKSALALSDSGVCCEPQFLPRSFIPLVQEEANTATAVSSAVETGIKKPARPRQKRR